MKKIFLIIILAIVSLNAVAESVVAVESTIQKTEITNPDDRVGGLDKKFKQSENITTKYILWVIFVLIIGVIISIVFIYGLKILLDKKNDNAEGKRVEILSVRRLSSKLNVFVIKVDSTEYIITSSNDANSITRHGNLDE